MSQHLKTVVLQRSVRLFRRVFGRADGKLLCQALEALDSGSRVVISEPMIMLYDHKNKQAVWTMLDGEEYFILVEEMGEVVSAT